MCLRQRVPYYAAIAVALLAAALPTRWTRLGLFVLGLVFLELGGTEQKRLYTIKGDELTYKVPTSSGGGTAQLVRKRAK